MSGILRQKPADYPDDYTLFNLFRGVTIFGLLPGSAERQLSILVQREFRKDEI
jgi:hypothetical protein